MNEALILMRAGVAGMALGALFFGGLWWTIRQATSSRRPEFWFFGSFLLRTSLILAGFYGVAGGHWERLLAGLLGFILARLIIMRFTRTAQKTTDWASEADHASES